jgi:hypothetical protein
LTLLLQKFLRLDQQMLARPGHEEHLENAALRSRIKKSYEKAQQEEAYPSVANCRMAQWKKL